MTGYRELRESAAQVDLSGRARILVRGEDRARFLHAVSTQHIEQMQPGDLAYCFFLDAHGHVLADAYVYCLEDRLLLDSEPELRQPLLDHFDKYIIADDVAVEDLTSTLATMEIEGPGGADVLRRAGAPVPESGHHAAWDDALAGHVEDRFRIIVPVGQKVELTQRLAIPAADAEAANVVRIEKGRPRYGEDITSASLAQETGRLDAIHFSKGCYLGQEIVERIRSRGHVNRSLVRLRIEGNRAPAPGTRLMAGSAEAGHITSAAFSPALDCVAALGYVRAQHTGASLTCEGLPAQIV